jgi:hypothetical protein
VFRYWWLRERKQARAHTMRVMNRALSVTRILCAGYVRTTSCPHAHLTSTRLANTRAPHCGQPTCARVPVVSSSGLARSMKPSGSYSFGCQRTQNNDASLSLGDHRALLVAAGAAVVLLAMTDADRCVRASVRGAASVARTRDLDPSRWRRAVVRSWSSQQDSRPYEQVEHTYRTKTKWVARPRMGQQRRPGIREHVPNSS